MAAEAAGKKLGQPVIIDNRPGAGAVVTLEGKEVGRVTSVVRSPRFGAIGLAILHHSAWTPGTELKVGEGSVAIVTDLPFAQS